MTVHAVLALALMLAAGVVGAQTGPELAACREQVEDDRGAVDGYLCFRRAGRSSGALRAALGELGRFEMTRGPGPMVALARGAVLADLGDPQALPQLVAAADGCRQSGSGRCEVLALLELVSLRSRWDPEGADAELERAEAVALNLGDGDLSQRVRVASAWRYLRGDQPARATTELEALATEVIPNGSVEAQVGILEGLGLAAWSTGRLRDSREHYGRLLDLAGREGDRWLVARATASFTLLDLQVEDPPPETVRERLASAVESARQASNPVAELKLRVLLAQALMPEKRAGEWQRAVNLARRLGAVEDELLALRYLARFRMHAGDASEAIAAMDEAQRVAHATGLRDAEIRSCCGGLELRWADGRLAEARERVGGCFDLIDALRERETLPVDRARVFARFAHVPRNAADALLGFENDIEGALRVLERYRARSLEETIAGTSEAVPEQLAGVRQRLARVQLELAHGRPTESRRRELEDLLDRLEADEQRLARAGGPETPANGVLLLAELQGLLDEGEVLVVFSLLRSPTDLWQTTGCWAIVVTRDASRAVPLPSFDTIVPAVGALAGLLGRTDQVARVAAARVYELLLGGLSAELEQAHRLIVLLDDPLHELPMAALRPSSDSAPLVSGLEIQHASSLGLWCRWRRARDAEVLGGAAVVVANPRLAAVADAALREAQLPALAELGRLPGAAEEGDWVARRLGRDTRLLVADTASEAALRAALTEKPRVLHIAAHAIVDGRRPERSAIVLAPGGGHDGLLHPRDIVDLDLDGSLVVLSACRSLDGEVVDGDGVVGLGHAFLEAGARAVIGAVRPLEDRLVPELMTELYRELEHGEPAARALAHAQARLAARGRPAATWATVLLVGDGTVRVAPGGKPESGWTGRMLAALALGTVVLALGIMLTNRLLRGQGLRLTSATTRTDWVSALIKPAQIPQFGDEVAIWHVVCV